jgi:hypothetical protein
VSFRTGVGRGACAATVFFLSRVLSAAVLGDVTAFLRAIASFTAAAFGAALRACVAERRLTFGLIELLLCFCFLT